MRVHMTFDLTDRQREAVGRVMGCRKPATRTQAVQWLSATVQSALEHALRELRELRRWEIEPDSRQMKFDAMQPRAEPAEERKTT